MTSCEALLRWRHPQRGLIIPNEFLPLAEQNDQMLQIGRWVLNQACRRAGRAQLRDKYRLRRGAGLSLQHRYSEQRTHGNACGVRTQTSVCFLAGWPDRNACGCHMLLRLRDRMRTKVKYRSGQHRTGATLRDPLDKMIKRSDAA